MRVLLQNRTSYQRSWAGDSTQIVKTCEYLNKLVGVEAEISTEPTPDLSGFDLVHLFNLVPVEETYHQFRNARLQGRKTVLSTIYWDPGEYLEKTQQTKVFEAWWLRTNSLRAQILSQVDMVLPSSKLELAVLHKAFLSLPPATVVPVGADKAFKIAAPELFQP